MHLANELLASSHLISTKKRAGDYSISSVGAVAEEQIRDAHQGQIMATFERSFYVKTATGLFCVGLPEIGCGPLNALLATRHTKLPFNVMAGENVLFSNGRLMFKNSLSLDASRADSYQCEISCAAPKEQLLHDNRQALKSLKGMPSEGFSWLVGGDLRIAQESSLQSALRESTSNSLANLFSWLCEGFSGSVPTKGGAYDASAALGLLGAGPGLTPAGDDLVAGVLLALIRLKRVDLAQHIWLTIAPSLLSFTHPISAAHLEQAAKGQCGESMNKLLNSVFQAENIEFATLGDALNDMGSTSGWDTLAGVVTAIDAWQHSTNTTNRTVTTC